ncbi:MAG: NAD kinase [Bacteroidales bacterium]|nr:NAD kinase [Bacteroidales bacterium]
MKIAIYGKTVADKDKSYLVQLIAALKDRNTEMFFFEPFYNKIKDFVEISGKPNLFLTHEELTKNADYLFSIGGDGTLLDTLSLVRDSGIPILGINLGRMGFLSSISRDRITTALDKLFEKKYILDKRTLIGLKTEEHLFGDMNYAVNEVSIYRKSPLSMLKIEAWVNDEFLNAYWADGLIVATPTGSTAYSLSNGGPIIVPGSSNFVITPIATHNLTVRPIVIPDSSKISIKVVGRTDEFYINLDSRSVLASSGTVFTIAREDFTINLVNLEDESYFKTIRNKLMWGLDIRN